MPDQKPDDKKELLLAQAKNGDRRSFDRMRPGLETAVRRFLYRLVGPITTTDEIVQDAFVALYQNLKRMPNTEALRPFLFRVIRNLCYDELKRLGRFRTVSWEQECSSQGASVHQLRDLKQPPDEAAQWNSLLGKVRKAMSLLPELQRQSLILYSTEDLSYAQIADAMGTDIGTVKSRIHTARKNLVKILGPEICEALDLHPKINPLQDHTKENQHDTDK